MGHGIAVVTGASSGIGEAFARRLARDRRDVVLVARRADRLERLADELRRAHGVSAHPIVADLASRGASSSVIDEIVRRGWVVDWLVNNAGFATAGRFDRLPLERELEEIRLNVEALVELTGLCIGGMVERGRGTVINVSSVGGFFPSPFMATYTATKAFVLSFSEAIAAELSGTGVHVLCVCPGFTRTEMADKVDVDASALPAFAWMSPEQVVDEAVESVGRSAVLVSGRANRLLTSTLKFVPRSLLARASAATLRPKSGAPW